MLMRLRAVHDVRVGKVASRRGRHDFAVAATTEQVTRLTSTTLVANSRTIMS
jgi:hypothetical protein